MSNSVNGLLVAKRLYTFTLILSSQLYECTDQLYLPYNMNEYEEQQLYL